MECEALVIPLRDGGEALVDAELYESLAQWKWYKNGRGYAMRKVRIDGRQRTILMHREIAGTPPGIHTDHINGEKLDNRRGNLRHVTNTQNHWNIGITKQNVSGYKGVCWDKRKGKWAATIAADGKHFYLGGFPLVEQAAKAYNIAARQLHGEYAVLNPLSGEDAIALPPKRRKSSQYRGVWLRPDANRSKPWRASMRIQGKDIPIGDHATEHEAAAAYNDAAIRHHGAKAILNPIALTLCQAQLVLV